MYNILKKIEFLLLLHIASNACIFDKSDNYFNYTPLKIM